MILRGPYNFRDLGGLATQEGRVVRKGLLFRSDSLSRMKPADWRTVVEAGVRSIVDFREEYERRRYRYRAPESIAVHEMPVNVGGQDIRREIERIMRGSSNVASEDLLVDVGRAFVEEHSGVFAGWLRFLAQRDEPIPHIFHCTVGKDRTGFAAALLLRILGVSEQLVLSDYLASNLRLQRFVQRTLRRVRILSFSRMTPEIVRPLLIADERYLRASFAAITERFGDLDAYVRDGLSLSHEEVSTLRSHLLA